MDGRNTHLAKILIAHGARELEILRDLRQKGWGDDRLDGHFQRQRSNADNAGYKLNHTWFLRMKDVMQEIDVYASCIPSKGHVRFLDLGCCPGGFSSYILQKNFRARGAGLSLEVENGGHASLLENRLKHRFELDWADLTFYQLGPEPIDDTRLSFLPPHIEVESFDIVLLDGHWLRTQTSEHGHAWDIDRLLISQLIIGLQSVKVGGSLVVKLSHPERALVAKLLYMMDVVSEALMTYKPFTMHANRGTFYAIAKHVGCGAQSTLLSHMIDGLRKLWVELTFGGDDGYGRFMVESDLDFIVGTDDLILNYLDRLIYLSRDVWSVQSDALQSWFAHEGI